LAKLYILLKKSNLLLNVDSQNIQRYAEVYKIIKAITASGIKPGADSSLALAELSKSKINYNQTLTETMRIKQQVALLTGIPVKNILIDTAIQNIEEVLKEKSDSTYNPLIDYYQKQHSFSVADEHLIKKSYLPKIMLTAAAWSRGSSFDGQGDYKSFARGLGYQRMNYVGGVTVVYNLFDGIHKKNQLSVAHYKTLAAEQLLQEQKITAYKYSR